MEGLCYFKVIDSVVRSKMDAAISGITSFSLDSSTFEPSSRDMKRVSPDKLDDHDVYASPLKQKRTECFEETRSHDDLNFTVTDVQVGATEQAPLEGSHCMTSMEKERKETHHVRQSEGFDLETVHNPETMKLNFKFLPNRHMTTSPVINSRMNREGSLMSQSLSSLGESFGHIYPGEINRHAKKITTTLGNEPEETRCRSLPCRMTPEIHREDKRRHFVNKRSPSPRVKLSGLSTEEIIDTKNELSCSQSDAAKNDTECQNEPDSCSTGPATPSSCFIDVEADTSPCSPLNLTINDNELQLHNSDVIKDFSCSAETNVDVPKTSAALHLERISHFHKHNDSFHINAGDVPTEKANEKPQEKKTNFSIDAILRPDFGAVRDSSQSSSSYQRHNVRTTSPRFRGTIKSSHSAFTAVDLSTRSRSDSLSSPSCSSSSPSPPLSTSSPSPRLKPEFNQSSMYDKHHFRQENFLLSSRLFPEPSKEYESYISRHIPFINPLHANGLGNFPFIYTSQGGSQNKISIGRDSLKHQHSQENIRTKTDYLKNDISKLLSRSFYPFASNPENSRNDILKLSRQLGQQIKTGSDTALQVLRHNQEEKTSADFSSVAKSPTKTQIQGRSSESKTAPRSRANGLHPDKDTSANCKIELKQEKPGQSEEKSGDSSAKASTENETWPAWVFCTRYSDRPSSGPRSRKPKRSKTQDEKRPRTAFTNDQLMRLKREFEDCRYLTETRRKSLADELGLTESQIKIWFQNKRAKIKKSVGVRNPLALQLMEQGLYNHSTVKLSDDSS